MKDVFKWGLIAVAVLVAWKMLSGFAATIKGGATMYGGSSSVPNYQQGMNYYAPNGYSMGVYGPQFVPYNPNPFYSSPDGNPSYSNWHSGRGGNWANIYPQVNYQTNGWDVLEALAQPQ